MTIKKQGQMFQQTYSTDKILIHNMLQSHHIEMSRHLNYIVRNLLLLQNKIKTQKMLTDMYFLRYNSYWPLCH